jgi:putative transposase
MPRSNYRCLSVFASKHLPVPDGRGCYLDNIFIERLWRSLKQEAVYLHELQGGFQAKRVIDEWLEFYNTERPHTALDKRTPDAAYFDPIQMNQAA